MRTTFNGVFVDGTTEVARAAQAMADAQKRVSSGRRINAPSDDPSGSESAIVDHATMDRMDAYTAASDVASSRLSVADAALTDMINQITAAKTSALSARGSTQTQVQRDAASKELLSIRDALANDINTKFHGTYLFSGSESTTAPYVLSGGAYSSYQGNNTQVNAEVAPGRNVALTIDGNAVFKGGDSQHVLDMLTSLAASVAAGDNTAIGQGLDALDRAFDRLSSAQSTVGNSLRVIDDGRGQIDAAHFAALSRASKVEDADLSEAIADLSRSESALRAALQSLATVGRLTLMDYLK